MAVMVSCPDDGNCKRTKRGLHELGSGQYELCALTALRRRTHKGALDDKIVPHAVSSAQAARFGTGTLAVAVAEHFDAMTSHLDFHTSIPTDMAPAEIAARSRASAMKVAKAEDDILQRQPNLYGRALLRANSLVVRATIDPVYRAEITTEGSDQARQFTAAARLLRDADNAYLDVDGISQAMTDMEGGEEWATALNDTTMDSPLDHETARRAAALAVAFSRSSNPDERTVLKNELDARNDQMKASRMRALGV